MAIIQAILAGERDLHLLAARKNGCIKASTTGIAAALTGDYRPEQLFVLQQELQLYQTYRMPVRAIHGDSKYELVNLVLFYLITFLQTSAVKYFA